MSSLDGEPAVNLSRLLGRPYWLVRSLPKAGTDRAAVEAHVTEHVAWLLELERDGVLFLSGPLVSGPGVAPGSGVTVLRADDESSARAIAERDPFVRAGLRTFEISRWLLNEGSIAVRVSLGTGRYEWS